MRNILFLHASSELYGSDNSLLNLLENLDKSNYKITVLLPQQGPLVKKIEEIENVQVIVEKFAVLRRKDLNVSGMLRYFMSFSKSVRFLRILIKRNDIDIVYTNTSVVFVGAITAKLMNKKSIWHIREIIANKVERKVVSTIVNMFSDIIIANSKATGDAITSNARKMKIIYNTINTTNIDLPDNKKNQVEKLRIGMAGRINRWKGQKLFVDAASMILSKRPNIEFLIAGNAYQGEEILEKQLKSYIEEKGLKGNVKMLGLVEDMNSFYNQINIFVLPSIQPEPFGLVVLEAMARSIPVVATNHGGPTEIITDGLTGFLVDYNSAEEMSNTIIRLIDDPKLRNEIGANGRINQKDNFSTEAYVEKIHNIIESL